MDLGSDLICTLIDAIDQGIVIVDSNTEILLWNKFMTQYSGIPSDAAVGKSLYELFPYLSEEWLDLKLRSVRLLKNFSFISWSQRPQLFHFERQQSLTADKASKMMYQDCTFVPVVEPQTGDVYVCIVIRDVTETVECRHQIEELEDMNRTLEQLSSHDALTGAFNRGYVMPELKRAVNSSLRYESAISVVLMDIDHFKTVNDKYGHLAGDEVLKSLAAKIKSEIRTSDIFARYGGEEFLFLLPNADESSACETAERIRAATESHMSLFKTAEIAVTASFGVACFDDSMKDYLGLVHAADSALYRAKAAGRNRVALFCVDAV